MHVPEEVACPISLRPPVAPHITPCGHVFSFPAIIQYLVRATDDLWGTLVMSPNHYAQRCMFRIVWRRILHMRIAPATAGFCPNSHCLYL